MIINYFDNNTFTAGNFAPIAVDGQLFRGSAISTLKEFRELKEFGITQIIDLRAVSFKPKELFPKIKERILAAMFGIKYKNFKYSRKLENMPVDDYFGNINQSIRDNAGKTYIHCLHGRRRTGICVAIYEMKHTNKTKLEILKELYDIGFKELHENTEKVSPKLHNRLIKIYNNFIDKFYPEETKLNLNIY